MFDRLPARHLLSGLLMLVLLSLPLLPQPEPRLSCGLRFIDRDMNTRVAPPEGFQLRKGTTADFEVTYTGFTPEARTAFQFAVDIWAFLITSEVPIKVDAHWVDTLGTTVLGASQPTSFFRFENNPPLISSTWYPVAIAEKLVGSNLNDNTPDIFAIFNQNFSNWYFGTDGNPPAGKIDFVTVVLHELGHGLGLVGSMTVSSGSGSWGSGTPYPFIFDRYPENNAGQVLINTAIFANPSAALATQLTGNNLFFDGEEARAENAGNRPKLYAPSTWQEGSSYAHLDESTYPAGDQNSLMTPSLGASEAIHNPGRITSGIFRDMGWTITSTGSGAIPVLSIFQNPALNGYLHLAANVLNYSGSSITLTANNLNVPVNPNGENGWYGVYQMTAPGTVVLKLTAGDATSVREFAVASLNRSGGGGSSFDQRLSIHFPPNSYERDTYLAIFSGENPRDGYQVGPDGIDLRRPATIVFHQAAPGQAIYRRDGEQWTALPTRTDSDGLSAETGRLGAFRLGPAPALIATSALLGNYPNPFNPSTRIKFRVGAGDQAQPAMLQVFNLRGQLQAELLNRSLPAGEHEVTWDGRDRSGNPAASGIYFYQLRIGSRIFGGKMILVR